MLRLFKNVVSLFHNKQSSQMKKEKVMENLIISQSAMSKMNDGLYSKVMARVKNGTVGKSIFGFKVFKINSSIILM